ncbi:MAG: FeoB-associated Cys-rich membrane protein [Anaerofustis stercorihominis]|nr:FeoB-associated Cys-rich membrane protein [Anaerofustis stercorihominis]
MTDIIVIAVVLAIVFFAARYVINEKKKGSMCIGCSAGSCPSKNNKDAKCDCGSMKTE